MYLHIDTIMANGCYVLNLPTLDERKIGIYDLIQIVINIIYIYAYININMFKVSFITNRQAVIL